jgi:putative spermidine/putrescine transport system ATP-binding protein
VKNASLPISIEKITKKYGPAYSLDHVDLEIKSGEFLTLLGPSGSGKTTLLTVLAGFTRPDGGSVRFGDKEMVCVPPHQRDVGMVFQNYALFPHMTVAENVAYPLKIRGVKGLEAQERVERSLEMVRLGGYGKRGIDQLSGGQKQRVALARAMVFEPRIMLMDEPLSALDKQLREHMQIELRQLHEKLGMTTVYVTHDQREALTMSDRIAVINFGKIMQLDTPRAIYERPLNKFVAEFIGESTFVPVQIENGIASFSSFSFKTLHKDTHHGAALLMLRPERLRVLRSQENSNSEFNEFSGHLVHVVYQGDSSLLEFKLPNDIRVQVRMPSVELQSHPNLLPGASLRMAVSVQDTVVLSQEELTS